MNEPEITLGESAPEKDREFVLQALVAYNKARTAGETYRDLNVLARDSGKIVGGLRAITLWNWLFVYILWVDESFRGKGIGKRMMLAAEREAVKRGCLHAHLDTFDFQALPFYQKLGYEIFGQLQDYPVGHRRYYLQKRNLREAIKG
jgi:GNAT superfamily N-acetyltransferase